ncbi:RNA polymerase sigma-70 factor (ECF subfamily) [Pedobacter cryoconitis]|uniref:RNA polymerase sigma-70 factor (ECF subfamily) n=1 Tax=Pedobacter cryoconitis TaxID=188932 RepID=A0A7W9DX01_9SPHI|nr:sigma-70 family RNA polymerase sigma factor [Pedobacter cryoconitis]MBB5634597.1 RNA polymerase sigma-70 factor (ECF subfamily) [Pedobacter cryoconitis]
MSNYKSEEIPVTEPPVIDPTRWVENHADYLFSYAITRINDEEQARDLVQETFLAALERIDKFEGRSSERTWLTSILKNKVIDVYRKKSSGLNKITTSLDAEPQDQDFFDATDGHWNKTHRPQAFGIEEHDPLMSKELNSILQKCMQKLPALWLSVFTMKHMDDETTDLICAELKVSPSNFWVIIHRAKLNLRACLQKNWT